MKGSPKSSTPAAPIPPSDDRLWSSLADANEEGTIGEPWYYRHLERYAAILKILGFISFAASVVLSTIWLILMLLGGTMANEGRVSAGVFLFAIISWLMSVLIEAAALFAWLVLVAFIYMAVDAARNIRAIRFHQTS